MTDTLLVRAGNGKRLTKQEAAVVRAALDAGHTVQFADRHQWRHFAVRDA